MRDDIAHILADWPYDDDLSLQVRRIEGRGGVTRIQIRIDLGMLQMNLTGRPDGTRPFGAESLLEHYRADAERYRNIHGWYEGYELDSEACAALRQESLQYYHRRISLMALQEYSRAAGDADHNLEILDLLKAFARHREDWLVSEQYRPFILGHRVQALALRHLSREDVRAALLEVEEGLRRIREVYADQDRLEDYDNSSEVQALQDLRRKVEARYQISHRQRLEMMLDEALRREEPDLAAELRAQLRRLEPRD
ncbi:MAG: hypothetical protein FJX77_07375 [Armatimonadetes bacterium]|nr:hypothetical protein [Armatimonadota bacterium]